ncbi:MAG: hypothetical protein LBI43_00695 [Streptococcaceae bacterium]|jgi:hypothetical protein|nr:hypothetical protein [Streptococcaceae bacterium]
MGKWVLSSVTRPVDGASSEDKSWWGVMSLIWLVVVGAFAYGAVFANGLADLASFVGEKLGGFLDRLLGTQQFADLGSQLLRSLALTQASVLFGRMLLAFLAALVLANLAVVVGGWLARRFVLGNARFGFLQAIDFYGRLAVVPGGLLLLAFVMAFFSTSGGIFFAGIAAILWEFSVLFGVLAGENQRKGDTFWLKLLAFVANAVILGVGNGIAGLVLGSAVRGILRQ